MNKELNLSAQDYSNAANTFLVGYIVFQLPGTLLVRKIGPPNQFALAMILVRPVARHIVMHAVADG
jgi:fucose permease